MSEIYLIRHAESAANTGLATASSVDIPLTDRGREQAETLAQNFLAAKIIPTMILVSPYYRTFATATPLIRAMDPPAPVVIRDSFREISYLAPQPNSTWEQRAAARESFWTGAQTDFDFHFGGESLNDFFARAKISCDFLTSLAGVNPNLRINPESRILAFSHEMLISALIAIAKNISRDQFLRELTVNRLPKPRIKNTQVAKLVLADSTLEIVNENLFGI